MATTRGGYRITKSLIRRSDHKRRKQAQLVKIMKKLPANEIPPRVLKKAVNLSRWYKAVFRSDLGPNITPEYIADLHRRQQDLINARKDLTALRHSIRELAELTGITVPEAV